MSKEIPFDFHVKQSRVKFQSKFNCLRCAFLAKENMISFCFVAFIFRRFNRLEGSTITFLLLG